MTSNFSPAALSKLIQRRSAAHGGAAADSAPAGDLSPSPSLPEASSLVSPGFPPLEEVPQVAPPFHAASDPMATAAAPVAAAPGAAAPVGTVGAVSQSSGGGFVGKLDSESVARLMLTDSQPPAATFGGPSGTIDSLPKSGSTPRGSMVFRCFMLSREEYDVICGGRIQSDKDKCCAKTKKLCTFSSHKEDKHEAFKWNRVFIHAATVTQQGMSKPIFYKPGQFNLDYEDAQADEVLRLVDQVNAELDGRTLVSEELACEKFLLLVDMLKVHAKELKLKDEEKDGRLGLNLDSGVSVASSEATDHLLHRSMTAMEDEERVIKMFGSRSRMESSGALSDVGLENKLVSSRASNKKGIPKGPQVFQVKTDKFDKDGTIDFIPTGNVDSKRMGLKKVPEYETGYTHGYGADVADLDGDVDAIFRRLEDPVPMKSNLDTRLMDLEDELGQIHDPPMFETNLLPPSLGEFIKFTVSEVDDELMEKIYTSFSTMPGAMNLLRRRLKVVERTHEHLVEKLEDLEVDNKAHLDNMVKNYVEIGVRKYKMEWIRDAVLSAIENINKRVNLEHLAREQRKIKRDLFNINRQLPSRQADPHSNPGYPSASCPGTPCKCCDIPRRELKVLQNLFDKQSETLLTMESRLRGLEKDSWTPPDTTSLNRRIQALEESMTADGTSSNRHVATLTRMNNTLSDLVYSVSLMENRIGSTALEFGNITIKSLADMGLFVVDNIKNSSFGEFFDFIALLDSLEEKQIKKEDLARSIHDSQKARFVSPMEVSTSTSFLHIVPLCFSNVADQTNFNAVHGSLDRNFPLVKTRKMWSSKGGRYGLMQELNKDITNQYHSLQQNIKLGLDGEGQQLANSYLDQSKACYTAFVDWTETFYRELMAVSNITEEESWSLVLECWMAFFDDLRAVRIECGTISLQGKPIGSVDRNEVVARYIWTMGKAIQVQNEYMEKQFRNHPNISTVINYYLFQQRVPTGLFETEIKSVKDDIKTLNSSKAQMGRDIKKLQDKSK